MQYLIAVPAFDSVDTDFYQSCLSLQHDGNVQWTVARSSLIYTARNSLVDAAIEGGFDRVLWLDSDMVFAPDLLRRLAADMDSGMEYVCGIYFKRKPPYSPVIYKELKIIEHERGLVTPIAPLFEDYPRDQVFQIGGSGFGAVMTSVRLLRDLREQFGQSFMPVLGFGEDLSFCTRVTKLGVPMFCDSRVKVGHVGSYIIDEGFYNGKGNG